MRETLQIIASNLLKSDKDLKNHKQIQTKTKDKKMSRMKTNCLFDTVKR